RLCADDSGRTSVKVGHRQALIAQTPAGIPSGGLSLQFCLCSFVFVRAENVKPTWQTWWALLFGDWKKEGPW
ncbi:MULTISPECIES: hypothetical protein, partial [unclassified Achromobacter]|uniref:hypothetical protein n=1 Tax=unclassified Achromobacter TaxID=2626865 RepID=UPI001E6126C6